MKIISGKWGGQNIPGKPSPKMRPTSDKVKEAVFDQLQAKWVADWSEITVLDLFAGTGSYGLEALSRGAKRAIFVDHHLATIQQLEKSCEAFGVSDRVSILCKGALEAIRWLYKKEERFDFIFLDPPYREDWVVASLSSLQSYPLLKSKGLVIAEHDKREMISSVQAVWKVENARRYGDTSITFLSPIEL
jgi:16S rRNA (guanine966-N2)-methyltransferase